MNFFNRYVPEFEATILHQKMTNIDKHPIHIKTLAILLVLVSVVLGFGWLLNLIQNVGYMFTTAIIICLTTYAFYKYFIKIEYNKQTHETNSVWFSILFDCLYMLVIFLWASIFLFFSVYLRVLSPFLGAIYVLLGITSLVIYGNFYKNIKTLNLSKPIFLPVNGFFLAVLFYSLTTLIHVNNFGLSIMLVLPSIFLVIRIKQYIEKRFYIKNNRYVIVIIGVFLIMLSFPFNKAFNYPSFYRGEFTLRIVYETLINPEKEFPKDVHGDVLFYNDFIVIASAEEITFYDQNLNVVQTYTNEYDTVYIMNDRLLANQISNVPTPYINLFEFKNDTFESIGTYYVSDPTDKVFVENDAYLSYNGYVYKKEVLGEEYVKLEIESTTSPTIIEQYDDYLVFRYAVPFFASTDSFNDEVQGYIFENIASNNGHIVFTYSTVFVKRNSSKVDPRDDGKTILYLTEIEKYFNDNVVVPATFEMPKLFEMNQFYYIDNHYYLVGHVEYSTGNFNYKILVLNEQAELEQELIYDGPSVAISEDYYMYGNKDSIKIFSLNGDTNLRYRIIHGYGITFATIALVSLFALDTINIKPKKKIDLSYRGYLSKTGSSNDGE